MVRIFISYKRVDKDKVFKIKEQIEFALGEKCWIDLSGIESSADFVDKICKAINNCEVFLFMYSRAHNEITDHANDWTIRELYYAQEKQKRIIYINIDKCELSDWFRFLVGTNQRVDGCSKEAIEKLCSDIRRKIWIRTPLIEQQKEEKTITKKRVSFVISRDIIQGCIGGCVVGAIIAFCLIMIKSYFFANTEDVLTIDDVSYKMIKVEGGTFDMGTSLDIVDQSGLERPIHKVKLSSYRIGETEVTQALWEKVMGVNPSVFKGDSLPVENVSWDDCQTFIKKLNGITGKKYRLPTEAEWEFASRGGNKSKNYIFSGSNNLDDIGWYNENSGGSTHCVASRQANELGIYDMSGNVYEWCSDYCMKYSDSDEVDPQGPNNGLYHSLRGGCWSIKQDYCYSSFRGRNEPSYKERITGLRLAISE